jgi:hypothetical protein
MLTDDTLLVDQALEIPVTTVNLPWVHSLGNLKFVHCNVCGSENHIPVRKIVINGIGLTIERCKNCGFFFTNPQPSDSFYTELYGQEYFTSGNNHVGFEDYEHVGRVEIARTQLNTLQRHVRGQIRDFLEIGSATGYVLREAKDRGWKIKAVEISDYCVRKLREQGFDVSHGTLDLIYWNTYATPLFS